MTDLQSIRYTSLKTNRRRAYWTSRICQQALIDFDEGLPVKPFAFNLGQIVQEVDARIVEPPKAQTKIQRDGIAPSGPGKGRIGVAKLGGKFPPRATALANQQRRFGLRLIDRMKEDRIRVYEEVEKDV